MKLKFLFLVIGLSLPSLLSAQQNIQWQDPVIAFQGESAMFPSNPQIAVTSNGTVGITFKLEEKLLNSCAFVKNGEDGFENVQFLNQSNANLLWWSDDYGPHIDAKENKFVVTYSIDPADDNSVKTKTSTDFGTTWQNEAQVDEYLFGDHASYPDVAIDGQGHPHVAVIREDGENFDVGAICSVDQGESYTAFILADNNSENTPTSPPAISIFGDQHLVVWMEVNENNENLLMGAVSLNNGATFETPVQLNDVVDVGTSNNYSTPKLVSEGNSVYVIWESLDNVPVLRIMKTSYTDLSMQTSTVLDFGNDEGIGVNRPCVATGSGFVGTLWEQGSSTNGSLVGEFGFVDLQNMEEVQLFNDDVVRTHPDMVFFGGCHLTYYDAELEAIMYMFGEIGTSVEEANSNPTINIYPNPTRDFATIELRDWVGQSVQINVLDSKGAVIMSMTTNKQENIDLSKFEPGIYTVQVLTGERSEVRVMIKE